MQTTTTIGMDLQEFMLWETLAYKRHWDYQIFEGEALVTADPELFREFGFIEDQG